jgi:hypothetical protein
MDSMGITDDVKKEVIQEIEKTEKNIISCYILNKILRFLHLNETLTGFICASSAISIISWIVICIINIIFQRSLSFQEITVIFVFSVLTGFSIFVVQLLYAISLDQNHIQNILIGIFKDELGVQALGLWFKRTFKLQRQILFSVITMMLALGTLALFKTVIPPLYNTPGLWVSAGVSMFFVGNGVYLAIKIPTLARIFSVHRPQLYPYNPSATAAINYLISINNKVTLANGFVASLVLLMIFSISPWKTQYTNIIAFVWLVCGLFLVTRSFFLPHFHLSRSIMHERIEQIQVLDNLIDSYNSKFDNLKEDDFKRLKEVMAMREKLYLTKNSSISLNTIKDYVTSILLPLFSFAVGFLKILEELKNMIMP